MSIGSKEIDMTIKLKNIPTRDAVGLKLLFEHFQRLGELGASRWCSYFADGDGAFRPKVEFEFSSEIPETTTKGYERGEWVFRLDSDHIEFIKEQSNEQE